MEEKKRKLVLLVDDDPAMLEVIVCEVMKDVDVIAVTTPEKAFNVIDSLNIDLIISDYSLGHGGGLTGVEVIDHFRKKNASEPAVIFTSTVFSEDEKKKMAQLYSVKIIEKINLVQLISLVTKR